MENEAYRAVKEVIASMKSRLDLSDMPKEEQEEFITNLDSLSNLNEILERFNQRGLAQFAHHVSVVIYLMLTNQPLLDKVTAKTKDVIAESGDYQIKNTLQ